MRKGALGMDELSVMSCPPLTLSTVGCQFVVRKTAVMRAQMIPEGWSNSGTCMAGRPGVNVPLMPATTHTLWSTETSVIRLIMSNPTMSTGVDGDDRMPWFDTLKRTVE